MSGEIVFLGSCSVDFTAYASRLPVPGETLLGYKFNTSFGGKGANQCVAAAKLNAKPHLLARLGSDKWGKDYKDYLDNLDIGTEFTFLTPNTATGIAQINVSSNGENQIVIVAGANNNLSINDVSKAESLLSNASIVVSQLETPFETTFEAFKIAKGLKILNAAPSRKDIESIYPLCSILCVNETEASDLSGVPVKSLRDAAEAARILVRKGCQTVVITLGKDGALFCSSNEEKYIHVLCDEVTPVDTTGAGDAFVGALATFINKYPETPLHQIIGAACKVATISVTKEGTQTSYPSDLHVFDCNFEFREINIY